MRAPLAAFRDLAAAIPDDPCHVDTRGMLLSGRCRVLRDPPDSAHFIVASSDGPLVSIVGRPSISLIRLAVTGGDEPLEVIARGDSIEHVSQALPDWLGDEIVVMTLPEDRPAPRPFRARHGDLGILSRWDASKLSEIPEPLGAELRSVLASGAPLAAAAVDSGPCSFCYAAHRTEAWWDVSVDTLEPYRGRGLAAVVFQRMSEHLAGDGVRPVWCALDSNEPSLRVAEKLGFARVDAMALFRKRS